MSVSEQLKILCVKLGISVSELGRISGKSPQAFSQKMKYFIAERVYETQKEVMRLLHIPFPKLS
jgi:hypothetical protein